MGIEWMNECLTTPQHEKQIGYWVSEKGSMGDWDQTDHISDRCLDHRAILCPNDEN